ncbi:MAG: outer membrane protein assembly factor BamE [Planctomycetota bacterium]
MARRKTTLIASLTLTAMFLAGCSGTPKYVDNFDQVRVGMDRDEVEELLGKPTTRHFPGQHQRELRERWDYGKRESVLAPSLTSPTAASTDVFVVYFGSDNKVKRYRRPTTGQYAEQHAAVDPES